MTDKQIIIDGVDIKDCKRRIGKDNFCRYYKRPCAENNYNCIWKKYLRKEQEYEELRQYHNKCCEEFKKEKQNLIDRCNQFTKDFFIGKYCKKEYCDLLKAKEQECEKLKEAIDGLLKIQYQLADSCTKYEQTLTEIKEIAEPYRMTIKKICGNCKKYNGYYAYCYKDINYYKNTSSETNACEEFTYLDELIPNILANNILQKISEVVE